jgi:hypothetical protein
LLAEAGLAPIPRMPGRSSVGDNYYGTSVKTSAEND